MDLHGIVFSVHSVFARGVEVELRESVRLVVECHGTVGFDLEGSAQVKELTTLGEVGDVECETAASCGRAVVTSDADGGLSLALGAEHVLRRETVPCQRAVEVGVSKLWFFDLGTTVVKSGSMMADGIHQGKSKAEDQE